MLAPVDPGWEPSTAELAGDALAAVELLRGRADIDPRRIGLYGSSNGAWVAPLAAAMEPERIAFVIARSASGLSGRENVVYEIESDLRAHGFGDEVVARMQALHRQEIEVVRAGGNGWNELRAALSEASAEPWFELVRLPGQLVERNDAQRARVDDWIARERARWWDPVEAWNAVECPALVQIGAADSMVPGARSAEILRGALRANPRATVTLFPAGDHALFESVGSRPSDVFGVRRMVPGYLAELTDWITSKVVGP